MLLLPAYVETQIRGVILAEKQILAPFFAVSLGVTVTVLLVGSVRSAIRSGVGQLVVLVTTIHTMY